MEIQKRGGTKIIPNHSLDKISNPSEAYLLPSRSNLTSYALEYSGALRMIRVSIFSIWLNPLGGVVGAGIYRLERPAWALGSNRLNGRRRCNLGGGGEPTLRCGGWQWTQGAGCPHLAVTCPPLWCGVLLSLLVSVSLWISVINSDMYVHLDGFLDKPYRKYRFTKTYGICYVSCFISNLNSSHDLPRFNEEFSCMG
jgi:hypothetical protein